MTQATVVRRTRKSLTPVDTGKFRAQIEQAMKAFEADVSYAVLMARAAVTIVRKREVWQARREARSAQSEGMSPMA